MSVDRLNESKTKLDSAMRQYGGTPQMAPQAQQPSMRGPPQSQGMQQNNGAFVCAPVHVPLRRV